ncbi:MAG: acetate uptake transporter [Candidatus Hadarchaeum sp.]|uniref:acetate uptake transporter n=1 Tax=Candidatus Hadarchaeum sp. TaxID=2883567 RepID=UPI0031731B04
MTSANPAPLGLMAFGMTTVLLNLVNAGILPSSGVGVIFAMGLFYGGIAQVIVGVLEFKKGNTFGTVAFLSYGMFWISLVAILLFPSLGWASVVDPRSMAAYLILWGIFSGFLFLGTLKLGKGLQVVFLTLVILFFLLAAADLSGIGALKTIAGIEGIFCGASAIYVAAAEVLKDVYKRELLPL